MPNAKDAHGLKDHIILALGEAGSGKSTQYLTLPGKKFAFLFDPNAILAIRGQDIDYEEFMPDRLNISAKSLSKDKPSDRTTNLQNDAYLMFERFVDQKMKDGFFENYDWIIFDSATTLLDLCMDRVLTINGRPGSWPQQDDYGPQMQMFTNICRSFTSMGKGIYMTGHVEYKEDKLTKRIFRRPMMTGRLIVKIPLLFSDLLIYDAENDGQGKVAYRAQTVPDRNMPNVRTAFKGLKPFEDVTLDFNKPLEGQGLGGWVNKEKQK